MGPLEYIVIFRATFRRPSGRKPRTCLKLHFRMTKANFAKRVWTVTALAHLGSFIYLSAGVSLDMGAAFARRKDFAGMFRK